MPTLQKILVTTDFSDNSSAVYDFTENLAKDFDATLDLVHIIPESHYLPMEIHAAAYSIDESANTEFRGKIKEKLETEFTAKIPEKYRGNAILKAGNPADTIESLAKENGYDLILIASRGEGNSIFNRGSVTEKLMRISHTPILSVLKDSEMDLKRITVPTDGSDVSLEALPLAYEFAVKRHAKIDLLSISKTNFTNAMMGEYTPYTFKDSEVKDYILTGLKEFVKKGASQFQFKEEPGSEDETFQLQDKKGNSVEMSIVVKKGDSAHLAVVDYAEKNAQLVVMATHGHSKLASMFVGSTTDKVFKDLKMPVMTVKPDFTR